MRVFSKSKNSFRKACSKIHLIDKCLIIIMFLLLIQSAFGLFFEVASSAEINTIDIIIRTATASIFGYFLSSNFICHGSGEPPKKSDSKEAASIDSEHPVGFKNKLGFSGSQNSEKPMESGKISFTPKEEDATELYTHNHLQIIITTAIAIFCLIILTIIRNSAGPDGVPFTASAQATISQFRDLISGCIGFLIGVPTTKNNK